MTARLAALDVRAVTAPRDIAIRTRIGGAWGHARSPLERLVA